MRTPERTVPAQSAAFRAVMAAVCGIMLLSCRTNAPQEAQDTVPRFADGTPVVTAQSAYPEDSLLVMFGGDIMQHRPNYANGHFPEIWEDIAPLVQECHLGIANLETPVDEGRPYDTYPTFNTHGEYVEAAIAAGFNVLSTANNHTNDQGLGGIRATKAWFDRKREETKGSDRPVYESGVKDSPSAPFTYELIETNGWRVLFLAATEILNRPDASSYINYVQANARARAEFCGCLSRLREENPADLFVLSFHCAEEEYDQTITQSHRTLYHDFLESGVDVVLANHPHVAKDWELVQDRSLGTSKLIFYAMGNTISAQRTSPSFHAPGTSRDYTGDGYLAQVRFQKTQNGITITNINPILITTYIRTDGVYVIRRLDDAFISHLADISRGTWSRYLEQRKALMERTKGTLTWQ